MPIKYVAKVARKTSKAHEVKMLIDRVDATLMVLALAIDDLLIICDELKSWLKALR